MNPSRGEIWLADFEPVVGYEQGGRRPCIILSDDDMNHGNMGLSFAAPLTTRSRVTQTRVAVEPPEGGLRKPSLILVEQTRCFSHERLLEKWGEVSEDTLLHVEEILRLLLAL